MRGVADERFEEAMARRAAEGTADALDLFAAARAVDARLLARREGALHALLLRLVREGRLLVVGRAPSGAARYAAPGAPVEPLPDGTAPPPPPASRAASRAALEVASGVRDPMDRGRVVSDAIAHLAALETEGRARAFGSRKAARWLLGRADRRRGFVAVPDSAWEHGVRWVLHEGPGVLLTAAVLFLAWQYLAEFRVIPSPSMVPSLRPGDRIVVRKAFGKALPARFEVVVFRRPRDGEVLVKRVAGLPGERIAIRGGDLVVDGVVARKPEGLREALRTNLFRQRLDAGPADGWSSAGPGGLRRLVRPLFADGGGEGAAGYPPRPAAHDVYLEAEAGREGALWIEYAADGDRPANEVAAVGWRRLADGREVVGVVRGAWPVAGALPEALAEGRSPAASPSTVTLAVVDGRLRLWAQGWEANLPVDLPRGRARVAVEGEIRALAVDRDLHYTSQGALATDPDAPYEVPAGRVFFLGDNSPHSNDSRFGDLGAVPLDHLIGPVVWRVWPPLRFGPVR